MKEVVVTGLGFISSIGNGRAAVLDSLRTGKSGVEIMPELAAANDRIKLAGTVKGFEFPTVDPLDWKFPAHVKLNRTQLRTMTPHAVFSVAAMDEAIADAALPPETVAHPHTGLYCASAGSSWLIHHALESVLKRGPMRTSAPTVVTAMPNSLHLNLTSRYGIRGASLGFSSACASSAHALGCAFDQIRLGRQKVMFVVGAEDCNLCSILPFASLRALSVQSDSSLAPRAFDAARDGFVVTGGAAVVILEEAEHAAARNARTYAEVGGWGQSSDGYDTVAPDPSGNGLARAMQSALDESGHSPASVDYINAHATATTAGDLDKLAAIKTVFAPGQRPYVSSTKSLTGHGLSLAGAMEAGFSCLSLSEGFMPVSAHIQQLDPACAGVPILTEPVSHHPRVAMSNSCGFGGANVSLLFAASSS